MENMMELKTTDVETAPGTSIVGETDKDGNKVVKFNPIFPTLMGSIKLPEIDCKAITRKVLEFVGDKENYEGGWTSFFAPQTDLSVIPGIDQVAQAAVGVSVAFARELKFEVDPEKATLQLWVSVMRQGGHHGIHSHPGSVVSGSFYVDVDNESAPLMIMNPTRHFRNHEPRPSRQEDFGPFTSEQLTIKPEQNLMVVWPAWLEHHVMKQTSQKPRVAISFNVNFPFYDKQ